MQVFLGTRDGRLRPAPVEMLPSILARTPVAVTDDFNGDGRLDFAVFDAGVYVWTESSGYGNPPQLLLSTPSGRFEHSAALAEAVREEHEQRPPPVPSPDPADLHIKSATSGDIDERRRRGPVGAKRRRRQRRGKRVGVDVVVAGVHLRGAPTGARVLRRLHGGRLADSGLSAPRAHDRLRQAPGPRPRDPPLGAGTLARQRGRPRDLHPESHHYHPVRRPLPRTVVRSRPMDTAEPSPSSPAWVRPVSHHGCSGAPGRTCRPRPTPDPPRWPAGP